MWFSDAFRPEHIHHTKKLLRRGVTHMAFTIFFADIIAAMWPSFGKQWDHISHAAVSFAALLAVVPEYLRDADHEYEAEDEAGLRSYGPRKATGDRE